VLSAVDFRLGPISVVNGIKKGLVVEIPKWANF
jgi:hypothetical protein